MRKCWRTRQAVIAADLAVLHAARTRGHRGLHTFLVMWGRIGRAVGWHELAALDWIHRIMCFYGSPWVRWNGTWSLRGNRSDYRIPAWLPPAWSGQRAAPPVSLENQVWAFYRTFNPARLQRGAAAGAARDARHELHNVRTLLARYRVPGHLYRHPRHAAAAPPPAATLMIPAGPPSGLYGHWRYLCARLADIYGATPTADRYRRIRRAERAAVLYDVGERSTLVRSAAALAVALGC